MSDLNFSLPFPLLKIMLLCKQKVNIKNTWTVVGLFEEQES